MVALAPTLDYDTQLAGELPSLDRAAQLQIPTKIIIGEKNPESIHEVTDQLHKAIPQAELVKLKEEDHMPSPEVVLQQLTNFLK